MEVTKELIGKRIRKIMEEKSEKLLDEGKDKLTFKILHDKSGVGESTIKNATTKRELSKIDDLLKIAHALDVHPFYLLSEVEDENYTVCEELGLANNTINILKKQCKYYPQNELVKLFDLLAVHTDLVSYLYQYLTTDYQKPRILLSENEYDNAITNKTSFSDLYPTPPETWDTTILLSVVMALRTVKSKIKGDVKNETGKR